MKMIFREAVVDDIPQIQIVRHLVKENVLSDPSLVTDSDCEDFISNRGKGWVCVNDDKVVGFAIADLKENNIWALFIDPEYERNGIGMRLHSTMLGWYFSKTDKTVWLSTDSGTKAEKFYRKAGWRETGIYGKGEIKFEMTKEVWLQERNPALNVQSAYDQWSQTYDEIINRTRDLEGNVLRKLLSGRSYHNCLEIGCGTGKNTSWLVENCESIIAVDLSQEMLSKAKAKINSTRVKFVQADINSEWNFTNETFDLITFSLVLEHIKDLDHIFNEVSKKLNESGVVYLGELHPFKQYSGSKARFETEAGMQVVECFNHHISDFTNKANRSGFEIELLQEYFDENEKNQIPRILAMLFRRKGKL